MNKSQKTSWAIPDTLPPIREVEQKAWRDAVERISAIGINKQWSKAQIAKRADISGGSFSDWFSGKYNAASINNITIKVVQFVEGHNEREAIGSTMASDPGYITTPTSKRVFEALTFAQKSPDMVVITLGAGMGKTLACEEYTTVRSHSHIVTMRPQTRTTHGMLVELCRVLGVTQNNPAKMDTAIGARLNQMGDEKLLIIDEAQNLQDVAVDQLRYFLDEYKCGIALVGNLEVYTRFGKIDATHGYGQLTRRVGYRVKELESTREDRTLIMNAWNIDDPDCRAVLDAIGQKSGALGQMTKTIKLASMLANGADETMTAEHLKAAWANRMPEAA